MVRVRGFDPRYIGSIPVSPAIRLLPTFHVTDGRVTVTNVNCNALIKRKHDGVPQRK